MKIFVEQLLLVVFYSSVVVTDVASALNMFPLLMPNVRPTMADSYLCTSIKVDSAADYYITAFEPNTTMNVAHHMWLLGCTEPGTSEEVFNCGEMLAKEPGISTAPVCKSGRQTIYGWARNAPKLVLPEDVGFRIGGKTDIQYLVLQVHYVSGETFKDGSTDNSGVFVYFSKKHQPKSAGVLRIGAGGRIMPRSTEFFETAWKNTEDIVIHPFAFRVHTHSLGRVVSGYKVTTGKDGKMEWTLIGKRDPMLPQMFQPVLDKKMTIKKGDRVAARCTMESDRDRITRVGYNIKDEMCFYFVMYWTDGPLLRDNDIFTSGPPEYYWSKNGEMNEIPDKDASALPVGTTAKELGYDEAAF